MKVHRFGGMVYTKKDHSLIKKLCDQFPDHAEQMAIQWILRHNLDKACNLGLFYVNRYKMYETLERVTDEPKDYGWD